MSRHPRKFYITTPIYYVNAEPHIGSAYTTIAADCLARFNRMIGNKTFFATGTDEHGAKIEEKAHENGKDPQEFVNEIAAKFQTTWDTLNISNDGFIRTTDSEHKKAVQKALKFMYDKGDIYLGKYEALYCKGCEQYKNEKDLVDGKCPDHGIVPETMSEDSYMFRLSKYAEELLGKIENYELIIRPENRRNEVLSFYKNEGLKDISFSRKNVKWGVKLPWDESHTAYVWADAFLNYLTILGWEGASSKTPDFWPADVQLMAKDILRVHSTIWPAMLLSLHLPLPKELFVHGYFMVNGQKMSKSLGNVIKPQELIEKYGVSGMRYLLIAAAPFGNDGDISWEKFDEKYNADLANGIGNLVARVFSMISKLQESGGKLVSSIKLVDFFKDIDIAIESMKNIQIDKALEAIWNIVKAYDKFITDSKPWELIGKDNKKAGEILYNCLEGIRIISVLVWPFMPETSEKIWQGLSLNPGDELKKDFKSLIEWGELEPETKISRIESLFPRL